MQYLLLFSLLLLAAGCEKDVKEVRAKQPIEVAAG